MKKHWECLSGWESVLMYRKPPSGSGMLRSSCAFSQAVQVIVKTNPLAVFYLRLFTFVLFLSGHLVSVVSSTENVCGAGPAGGVLSGPAGGSASPAACSFCRSSWEQGWGAACESRCQQRPSLLRVLSCVPVAFSTGRVNALDAPGESWVPCSGPAL